MRNEFLDFSMISTSDLLALVAGATDSREVALGVTSTVEAKLGRVGILGTVNHIHYFVYKI